MYATIVSSSPPNLLPGGAPVCPVVPSGPVSTGADRVRVGGRTSLQTREPGERDVGAHPDAVDRPCSRSQHHRRDRPYSGIVVQRGDEALQAVGRSCTSLLSSTTYSPSPALTPWLTALV